MKLLKLGNNQTQLHIDHPEHGEMTILYSYTTPVALKVLSTQQVYKTTQWHSKTTTRHINTWTLYTPPDHINEMSQPNIEAMIRT